jgi:granule-bound starch synthase
VRAQATTTGSAVKPVEKSAKPMNLLFLSAEVSPWSKTGGLGDVVGALPIALAARGHKVITVSPRYDQYKEAWDTSVTANVCGEEVRFFHAKIKGVDRVFVDNPLFLAKIWGKTGSMLYGKKSGSDFSDNQKRFRMFCEAALEANKKLPFGFGDDCVIVANDWHSAMTPVLLKDIYQPRGEYVGTKCALCVHNIAFQGRFFEDSFKELNLPESSYKRFAFEDGYPKIFDENSPADDEVWEKDPKMTRYKKINWLQAGFTAADKLLTVSPNYATEVGSDEEKGVELDSAIRAAGGIEGIVNGMDVGEWNPAKDKFLDVKYDKTTVVAGKAAAKELLQAEAGLPVDPTVPLFGFIGRLEEQKGVDIMIKALPKILKSGKAQVVVLGTGKKKLEAAVRALDKEFPGTAAGIVKFSAPMAHYITAGADFMLVPSRFEPCGLIQLHAMQYGTVPIVASTGGLVDTVKEGVTGFQMGAFDAEELAEEDVEAVAETVSRAAETYGTPTYAEMSLKCISQDLSWDIPAKKWEGVLEELSSMDAPAAQIGADKKASVTTPVSKV